MDDNFSSRVKDVITYSKEEAIRLGHDFIGTEHLLLGILRDGGGKAIKILNSLDIDLDFLRKKIEILSPPNPIMNFEEKIKELNVKLPEAKAPVGNYVATKISGKMLFISGQISIDDNGELIKGKVGKELDVTAGYNAAKRCALSIIAQVKKACDNDLSKIKSCVKLTGFVNSTDDFIDQPKVINGASDLIASIFGDAGMHTRAAVSTNSLPLGVSVEVDAIFELN